MHKDELNEILNELHPRVIIYEEDKDANIQTTYHKLSIEQIEKFQSELIQEEAFNKKFLGSKVSNDPLLIIFSSGSTGKSKGIILTEHNLVSAARNFLSVYPISDKDVFICVMPCFHMNALMLTGIVPFLSGAKVILCKRFKFNNAKFYLDNIRKYGVSILSVTPSIMAVMIRIFRPTTLIANQVKFALCGVAPLHETVWRSFEDHFHIKTYQGYGLTETTFWATMSLPDLKQYNTVGTPVNCDVKIDALSSSQSGEILIRGPILMYGYLSSKEQLTVDGFFRTGDIGYFNDNSQLIINGRIKDLIIRNGINIFPKSIDSFLINHPDVLDCASVGLPATISGKIVCTTIVPKNQTNPPEEASILEWLRERISKNYLPDKIYFLESIPKTPTGKIARQDLINQLNIKISKTIVQAINNRKTIRHHIKEDSEVASHILKQVQQGIPIQFVKYWGVGDRFHIEDVDRKAIDRIINMMRKIDLEYNCGVNLNLIMTGIHARINGKERASYETYFFQIAEYIKEHGVLTISSEVLWEESGDSFEKLYEYANSHEAIEAWQNVVIRDELLNQALKHSLKFNNEEAARLYYYANIREREYIYNRYKNALFLTYNKNESHNELLPNLPKIYLHTPQKPWFAS